MQLCALHMKQQEKMENVRERVNSAVIFKSFLFFLSLFYWHSHEYSASRNIV